ncbi:MAG: primosomal replication protein N [Bordetella sp.]|nr:MAG: primosomal replication protein N [Bordetella sp.]
MNKLELTAQVLSESCLRYTPSGLPVLEVVLSHKSEVLEAGEFRYIKLKILAVAIGDIATSLSTLLKVGKIFQVCGFIAPISSNSSELRLHLQQAYENKNQNK